MKLAFEIYLINEKRFTNHHLPDNLAYYGGRRSEINYKKENTAEGKRKKNSSSSTCSSSQVRESRAPWKSCGGGGGGRGGLALSEKARELRSHQNKPAIVSLVTEFAFYPKSFRKTSKVLSGERT